MVRGAAAHETLQTEHPPIAYYSSLHEDLERAREPPPRIMNGHAQQQHADKAAVQALSAA